MRRHSRGELVWPSFRIVDHEYQGPYEVKTTVTSTMIRSMRRHILESLLFTDGLFFLDHWLASVLGSDLHFSEGLESKVISCWTV